MAASQNRDPAQMDPTTWLDEYGDALYRYALSRLRDPEASEEVVQETLVAGLQARHQYAGRGDVGAWLMGILKRKIIDHVRRQLRSGAQAPEESEGDVSDLLFDQSGNWREDPRIFGARPEAAMERKEFWEALRLCLDQLPPRQANVFSLREIEDLGSEEICKNLEITASNLWVLLYRARLGLSRCLKGRLHLKRND